MEKEKLSERLVGLVGENSLSDRTWNDYLDNSVIPFLPGEEDKVGDFLTRHATALKSLNGQLNNEVATRVNDFKKNYNPETQTSNNEPKPQDDEKLKDIESRLSKFEKAEAEAAATKMRTAKLDEAKKLMKEQGASHETVLNLIIPQLDVSDSITASDLAKKGKELYDKTYSDLYGDSYIPASNNRFGGNKKGDKEAYLQHLRETGRIKN